MERRPASGADTDPPFTARRHTTSLREAFRRAGNSAGARKISSAKPAVSRMFSSGGQIARGQSTIQLLSSPRTARQSVHKSLGNRRRPSDGPSASRDDQFHAAAGNADGSGKSLTFQISLVWRHDEFFSHKVSVRADTEAPPEVMCAHYDTGERSLFLGLSTGALLVWKDAVEGGTLVSGSNSPVILKAKEHLGAISSMIFLKTLEPDRTLRQGATKTWEERSPGSPSGMVPGSALTRSASLEEAGFLFTGSADRNIKLWVVQSKKIVCVRTLCLHGGTVISLSYCYPYLFSTSTDGTALICRADPTSGSLKHPQFTVVEKVFTHTVYHPSIKLVLSNKKAWYDTVATRSNGDRISVYYGATDGSILMLDNTQASVPANPVIGGGGAPPTSLHTQERATLWNNSRNSATLISLNGGKRYSTALCDTSCWDSLLAASETAATRNSQNARASGRASEPLDALPCATLPVPFRIQNRLNLHTLGLRKVYCLPLDSVVATLGSDASLSIVDPLTGQVWWKEENPEGCCYSACTWLSSLNMLLVGDDHGNLSFYNIYSKERIHSQQVTESRISALCVGNRHCWHCSRTPSCRHRPDTGRNIPPRPHSWDVHKGVCTRVIKQKYPDITSILIKLVATIGGDRLHQGTRDASQYRCLLRHAENSWMLMEDLNGFLTGHEDGDVRFWTLKDFSSFSVYNTKGSESVRHLSASQGRRLPLSCAVAAATLPEARRLTFAAAPRHHIHINSVASMCCWRPTPHCKPDDCSGSKGGLGVASGEIAGRTGPPPGPSSVDRGPRSSCQVYHVLTCGYDGRMNVTELRADEETGEVISKFIDAITCLANGSGNLISGSVDKTIRFWDVKAGDCIRVLRNQSEAVLCITPFGGEYTGMWSSVSWSGRVSVWDASCRVVASKTFGKIIACCACVGSLTHLLVGTGKPVVA
ncbi:wd g-beta repeat protein [Cystoisospora suis]|uniref:Wd g-beta repeat protein n=1 Tax=Cystoisospora suis TaxID=483139 RepID=A0A2C6L0X2_9APIC|nr:wd g-beta repeat protein [Cystoisospora suis]